VQWLDLGVGCTWRQPQWCLCARFQRGSIARGYHTQGNAMGPQVLVGKMGIVWMLDVGVLWKFWAVVCHWWTVQFVIGHWAWWLRWHGEGLSNELVLNLPGSIWISYIGSQGMLVLLHANVMLEENVGRSLCCWYAGGVEQLQILGCSWTCLGLRKNPRRVLPGGHIPHCIVQLRWVGIQLWCLDALLHTKIVVQLIYKYGWWPQFLRKDLNHYWLHCWDVW